MTDEWNPNAHRRRDDPDTSAQGAERVNSATLHKQLLLRAHLQLLGTDRYGGFTALENAEAAEVDPDAAHKRCSDLVRKNHLTWIKAEEVMVLPSGVEADREGYLCRRNPTRKLARIMGITAEGIEWLRNHPLP